MDYLYRKKLPIFSNFCHCVPQIIPLLFCTNFFVPVRKLSLQSGLQNVVQHTWTFCFCIQLDSPRGQRPPHCWNFENTIFCRTPPDKWLSRCRDLYLTTHNTHNRQTSMPSPRFDPAIQPSEWPQTHSLDRAATGIGRALCWCKWNELVMEIVCSDRKHLGFKLLTEVTQMKPLF
jgi:hypothetical protein